MAGVARRPDVTLRAIEGSGSAPVSVVGYGQKQSSAAESEAPGEKAWRGFMII